MRNSIRNTISQLLSSELLRDLAGELSYSRGEQYFEEERVSNIHLKGDSIHAKVRGSRLYRVELWEKNEELNYSCTCPFYQDNLAFCKHCVAVGLAFLQSEEKGNGSRKQIKVKAQSEMALKDVKAYIETQDKASLIAMLLQYAEDDEALRSRLLLKAGKGGKKVHLPTFKTAIDDAVDWGDFVDYKSMYEYTRGIEDVISSLHELLKENRAAEVVELSEYFLKQLEVQMGMVDDSDGYMGGILSDIQELHHDACAKTKPDPEQLARKLFEWELRSDWEVFYGASTQYADVLGKEGLKVYEELAEKEWAKIPSLGPGDDKSYFAGNRFRITSIMERLASQIGDVEKLVTVKTKDLSLAYSYLQIAEIYKKAGNMDKAIEWAEKGVKAFPKRTDSRLREFLANEYHKRKQHDDALQLIWAEFADSASFEKYKLLKIHAERTGGAEAWKHWREKALQFIRDRIAEFKRNAKSNQWIWNANDYSDLVQIFLWEKDIDAAWKEAQEGGCQESLWLELAAKRETDYPEDALAVYQSFVEPQVKQMNNESYREATALVKKIGILFKRLGKEEEWNNYLNTLRMNHKKKRNFMALLEKVHTVKSA